jgi:ABC-type branched-subunit amino acid transport system substrate-binding protein
MQHKTVAFVSWSAGAGQILAKAFPSIVDNVGLKLSYQALFDPSSDPIQLKRILSNAINPLRNARPDAVVLVAGGDALYESIRQIRSVLGGAVQIYTISSVNWMDLVKNLGVKQAQGVAISQAVPYPYSPRLPIAKAYLSRMRQLGRDANYYSFEGYLGAAVVAEALNRAAPNITSENVNAALSNLGRYELGGFEVLYARGRHQGFKKPDITLITSQGVLLR